MNVEDIRTVIKIKTPFWAGLVNDIQKYLNSEKKKEELLKQEGSNQDKSSQQDNSDKTLNYTNFQENTSNSQEEKDEEKNAGSERISADFQGENEQIDIGNRDIDTKQGENEQIDIGNGNTDTENTDFQTSNKGTDTSLQEEESFQEKDDEIYDEENDEVYDEENGYNDDDEYENDEYDDEYDNSNEKSYTETDDKYETGYLEVEDDDNDHKSNYSYQRNYMQTFYVTDKSKLSKEEYLLLKKIEKRLLAFFEAFAMDESTEQIYGADNFDIDKYILKKYEKKPYDYYLHSNKKENIYLVLDNSGSCVPYSNTIVKLATVAEKFNFVQIYIAPNGYITHKIHKGKIVEADWQEISRGSNIIFFGDFDGGDILVEQSERHNIIWLCCEERYDDLNEHSWNRYSLKDFKGIIFETYSLKDILEIAKVLTKKVQIFSDIEATRRSSHIKKYMRMR